MREQNERRVSAAQQGASAPCFRRKTTPRAHLGDTVVQVAVQAREESAIVRRSASCSVFPAMFIIPTGAVGGVVEVAQDGAHRWVVASCSIARENWS